MSNTNKIIEPDFDWVNFKEEEILSITKKVDASLKEYKNEVVKIKKEDLNFKNYIHYGEEVNHKIAQLTISIFPFANLHPDKKFRDAALRVELELSKILNEFAYDEEIYRQFLNYYNGNYKKEKKELTVEDIKIVDDSFKGYKKMGMNLSKKDKKILLDKKNKISKLAQEFEVNTSKNYEKGTYFRLGELEGIPEAYIKSFKYDDKKKKYFVNCSGRDDLGTDYPIIKKYCKVLKTREIVTKLNEDGVGEKNNKKLREILKLRNDIKNILGFDTWADLAMDEEMMSKPVDARKFLSDLISKLSPDYIKFNKQVEGILKNEMKEKLTTASFAYGKNILKGQQISVNEEEYKPYFELEKVIDVLFKTWENLFDIKTKIEKNKYVFHEDTLVLSFTDTKTGNFLGKGVFDLHPRSGKYGHACVADISKKYLDLDGNYHAGLTYMVCNFKKATQGKTFITLSDMNTLYHEAGHMLHMILMKNNYISTGSTSRDFVEIPSQFHENFLLNEKFISENFRHCETGEKMPKKLIENIRKMNTRGESYSWIRTSFASLFDQEIHGKNILKYSKDKQEIDKLFNSMWVKYLKINLTNKSMHFPSTWGHLVGGYDAKYYSYVISKVYSVDFWSEFAKGGIKKGKMSLKYKKFLEGANTRPEKELVKEYLQRKVSLKPFLQTLKD